MQPRWSVPAGQKVPPVSGCRSKVKHQCSFFCWSHIRTRIWKGLSQREEEVNTPSAPEGRRSKTSGVELRQEEVWGRVGWTKQTNRLRQTPKAFLQVGTQAEEKRRGKRRDSSEAPERSVWIQNEEIQTLELQWLVDLLGTERGIEHLPLITVKNYLLFSPSAGLQLICCSGQTPTSETLQTCWQMFQTKPRGEEVSLLSGRHINKRLQMMDRWRRWEEACVWLRSECYSASVHQSELAWQALKNASRWWRVTASPAPDDLHHYFHHYLGWSGITGDAWRERWFIRVSSAFSPAARQSTGTNIE